MGPERDESAALGRRNDRVMLACAVFVAAMVGLSFAAVPLYRMFCQATGFGGTTRTASHAPGAVADKSALFTISFDSNVASGLPWSFAPETRALKVVAGAQTLAFFKAVNHSDRATTGSATYNVTPDAAGAYFRKVQCFCFDQQTLGPGQAADMPVSFFVDPAILDDRDLAGVRDITLSYTFFPAVRTSSAAEAARAGGTAPARVN